MGFMSKKPGTYIDPTCRHVLVFTGTLPRAHRAGVRRLSTQLLPSLGKVSHADTKHDVR